MMGHDKVPWVVCDYRDERKSAYRCPKKFGGDRFETDAELWRRAVKFDWSKSHHHAVGQPKSATKVHLCPKHSNVAAAQALMAQARNAC